MAVSPNVFDKDERDEAEKMAIKAKSLAVRTNSNDRTNGQPKKGEAEPEVAEQMNLETKKKYAKGWFSQVPSRSHLQW